MPKFNNQDVDVKELEAEFGHIEFVSLDQAIQTLQQLWSEPELEGDDIEDARIEYLPMTLEDRADRILEQGLRILKEGVDR